MIVSPKVQTAFSIFIVVVAPITQSVDSQYKSLGFKIDFQKYLMSE